MPTVEVHVTHEGAGDNETALTAVLLDPSVHAGDTHPQDARLRVEAPVAHNADLGL